MEITVATTDFTSSDPKHWNPVKINLPAGYYRVWSGTIKPGDLFLNLGLIREGITSWEPLNAEYELKRAEAIRCTQAARMIECVIRKGSQVEQACERCQCQRKHRGWKYCNDCAELIRKEIAERSDV